MWRTVNEGGIKSRVWLPSGQEILASSGILEWKEDLDHLERQFTVEQQGTCDGYDLQQMKRDERVMRDTARLKQPKVAKEERLQNSVSVGFEDDSEESETEMNAQDEADPNLIGPK